MRFRKTVINGEATIKRVTRYQDAHSKEPLADTVIDIKPHDRLEAQKLGFASVLFVEDTRESTAYPFIVYNYGTNLAAVVGTSFETLKEAEDWNLSRKI